jgi:hypothetical protein
MTKKKLRAQVMVADRDGGMTQLIDRRFEGGRWPIGFEVPTGDADTWLQYLSAECHKRSWSCSAVGQIEAKENSGSIIIRKGAADSPGIDLIWERKRGGPINVRARAAGTPALPTQQISELFERVTADCHAGVTEAFYRQGQLYYDGRAWRGEIWLTDTLRLGPPSVQDETAVFGPRVVLVDAQIDGISWSDANSAFAVMLRELAVFLSVLLRTEIRSSPQLERVWTWQPDALGHAESETRQLGYIERAQTGSMPGRGVSPAITLVPVQRPVLGRTDSDLGEDREQSLPEDTLQLWQKFAALPGDRRRQFIQVASMWQASLSLSREYQTSGFAWMVATCEALKPPGSEYRDHNIYHVIEALLGRPQAARLREQWFQAQEARSRHFHTGELRGPEFTSRAIMSSFEDPSFRQARTELWQTAPAAIIEWLRRSGEYTLPLSGRGRKRSRRLARASGIALPVLSGAIFGWLLHGFIRQLGSGNQRPRGTS